MIRTCVYCLNDNPLYFKMLFNSIGMLRLYSNIDIQVILVGQPHESLNQFCAQNRVKIIYKEPIPGYENYFPINKKYVCDIDADSVLFIDCDTFIFNDVNKVFDHYANQDFVACQNRWVYGHQYQDSFLKNSISPFNSGVMLFNRRSQFKIYDKFDFIFNELNQECTPLGQWLVSSGNKWTIEEFAVSKCVTDLELNVAHFDRQYCYNIQWPTDFDKMQESIVFHTYTKQWEMARQRLLPKNPKSKIPKKLLKISAR